MLSSAKSLGSRPGPTRIWIKGASGCGKSTLGRELARRSGLRFVELDALHHGPNWSAATAEELRTRVQKEMQWSEGWIIDGNYDGKLGSLVRDNAQLIVWIDLPLSTQLMRLARRTVRRWLTNEELWNGNRETLKEALWGREALFAWAVRTHFSYRRTWPSWLAGRNVVRLRSAREVAEWLEQFTRGRFLGDFEFTKDIP